MKRSIFLARTDKDSYTKITLKVGERRNVGCIEHDGHLNVKEFLRDMLQSAGGDFSQAPGYQESKDGKTHGVAGSDYHSYAKFANPLAAKQYLERYFDVNGDV